jgi:hypothetical protein
MDMDMTLSGNVVRLGRDPKAKFGANMIYFL